MCPVRCVTYVSGCSCPQISLLLILTLHDSPNLGPFGSNKKFLHSIHRSASQCMVKRFFVLVLLFFAISLSAQSLHLTGSVKSSDGKPIPNASIELREQDTGARSKTASDHHGS
jgi:preprotein translocase subunit SecG